MNLAIRTARLRSRSTRPTSEVGFCLREVRECFAVDALYMDAAQAWEQAKHKHRTSDPREVPRGAPVFWTGGSEDHGHIAIGTGWGRCWSTDILRPGYFDRVPIDLIRDKWGMRLVGWTNDLNGVPVYTPNKKGWAA